MEKKMILVSLSTRSLGREFFKVVIESLRKRYVVFNSINYERLRFETPHTRTWFVFSDDPDHMLAGIRADAVFGSGYRWIVSRYAKSDAVVAKADNIGLVDYICKVEREANYDERKSEFFLNNPYRPYPVNGYVDTDSIREKRVTDTWIGDMWPPTLFMKPLTELEKRLYRQMLNATYGKYGTFSSKPRKLDPALFNNEEIKPLASGKTQDGLRIMYPIDEWDSYKYGVTSGLWPKTNPYLMSKEDIERIFQEGSKQFADRQLIYALGRGNGKSTMCLKQLEKEFEEKEGEKIMNNAVNDLIMNKRAYLVTDNSRVPVLIENLSMACGEATSFEGHILEPSLNDIIERRVNSYMNKPTKLPGIKTVHFSGPVTAVIWEDKTKTVVRANDGEFIDYEKGLAMAIAKKALGTNKSGSNYYDIFKKYLPKPEVEEEAEEVTA